MEGEEEIIWEQEDETGLIVRKSRHGEDNKPTYIAADDIVAVSNGVSESNGHVDAAAKGVHNEESIPEGEEQKLEEPDRVPKLEQSGMVLGVGASGAEEEDSANGEELSVEDPEVVLGSVSEAINGEPKPENLVFYDKVEGIWKCQICSWTYQNGSVCVDHVQNHKGQMHHKLMSVKTLYFEPEGVGSTFTDFGEKQILKDAEDSSKFDISALDSVVQNTAASHTLEGDIENDNFSGSKYPHQDYGKSRKSSTEIESVEVDLINDDDIKVTEFDVERVLQKQTTHDLYCPNCNSCITKRVILRKRKRRIGISDEEVKRNKKEPVVTSKLGTGEAQSPSDKVQDIDEVGENGTQAADKDEHNRGPDVFRCLSCFSFFIPMGNGLFQLFGGKNGKESMSAEQASNKKKNINTSMTSSAAGQGTSTQTDAGMSVSGVVASSNSNDQIGQPSSLEKADSPSHASEGNVATSAENDTCKSRDMTSSFLNQTPLSNGKVIIAVRDQLDMTATGTVDAKMEHFNSYTEDQLKEPNYVNSKSDSSVTAVSVANQFTNGESVDDAISFPKENGLKLLISSSKGSVAPEILKDSLMPNQTKESGGEGASTDKGAIHHSAVSVTVSKVSDKNGNLNNSVSAPHEELDARDAAPIESVLENKNANFRSNGKNGEAYPTEVSPLIISKTKIEVQPDEPIKLDSISYSPAGPGKDAVITIEAQPAGSSQIVANVIHPTETTTSPQPATQIGIAGQERTEERNEFEIEVIKSIVYGGLAESITSLGVVSSAAGGGAATLNVLALGVANLIGGLFIICHNIWDLRDECTEQVSNQVSGVINQRDRYKELLGRRQNFILHAAVAIISYLIFGLVPPVGYGFSFHKTDDKQLKLVVAAVASLICIALLAIGRAYVQRPSKPYLKSVMTFLILGFMVSGVAYAAGELVERLLVKLGLFQSGPVSNLLVAEMTPTETAWASY